MRGRLGRSGLGGVGGGCLWEAEEEERDGVEGMDGMVSKSFVEQGLSVSVAKLDDQSSSCISFREANHKLVVEVRLESDSQSLLHIREELTGEFSVYHQRVHML